MNQIEGPLRQLLANLGNHSAMDENWTLMEMIRAQFSEHFQFSQLSVAFTAIAGLWVGSCGPVLDLLYHIFLFAEESMSRKAFSCLFPLPMKSGSSKF